MLILTETERRGRRRPHREAAQARRAPAVRRRAASEISVTISIGIAGGGGAAAPDRHARPRRRCGDVLGEVARAQPDLHLRGARRGRPRPARADLAGRAGPWPWRSGGRARDAATASLTSVIAPLPHYRGQPSALIAVDRRRDGPPARAARGRGRPDPGRGPAPRRRQGRRPRGDPREAGGAHLGRVADRRPASRGSARSSSSRRPRCATRCRSSSTTTSATPATATRTGCAPTRSRSARGSWRSPTPTTR